MKRGQYYLRLVSRLCIAFALVFSIMLGTCVSDVFASELVVRNVVYPGTLYRTFYLSSDGSSSSYSEITDSMDDSVSGSSTGSSNSINTSDYSTTSTSTTTTYSIVVTQGSDFTEGNISTVGRATYQIDLKFSVVCDLGRYLYPSNLYSLYVSSAFGGDYVNSPVDSYVSCISKNYYVLLQGERYECSDLGRVEFMKHTSNAYEFIYVVELSYIVTTSTLDIGEYSLGIVLDNVNYDVYDHGLYNSSDDLKGSVDTGNDLQQNNNVLQEENNKLQEEQNETTNNIFSSISDFFGSFFDNLIGIFVPEEGYFEEFFERLNTFFSDKLGMLYAPIDIFIEVLTAISEGGGSAGITFPQVKWQEYVLIEEQTINLQSIADELGELQEYIYLGTDVIMVGSVINLLQNKLREVLKS